MCNQKSLDSYGKKILHLKKNVVLSVTNLHYPNGGTTTALAIVEATRQLQDNRRDGIPRVIVVITDGISEDPRATLDAANDAKDLGIIIYSIGMLSFRLLL